MTFVATKRVLWDRTVLQNAFVAGVPPQTMLGEVTAQSQTP